MAKKSDANLPIGERLRRRRMEILKRGLREVARLLGVTPAHMTDLEKGRRTPSEELLVRISHVYDIPEPELRAGWSRAAAIVGEVATQDAMTAEKVPEFLRTARRLSSGQWDRIIREARRLSEQKEK